MTLTTVPHVPDGLTPSAARIYTALHAAPGSTVAELARTAGTGKSTAANLLKQMEQDGLVRRIPGGSDGNRRFPDHWHADATSPSEEAPEQDNSPEPTKERAEPARSDSAGDETRSLPGPTQDDPDPSRAEETPESSAEHAEERSPAGASAAEPQHSCEAPPSGRLGQGGLRILVHGFLAENPGTAHSPTKISRHLGRSSGAVANALVTLVNLGQAEMVTSKPRTYRLVATATNPK
jgi:predicted transcriptional regulator